MNSIQFGGVVKLRNQGGTFTKEFAGKVAEELVAMANREKTSEVIVQVMDELGDHFILNGSEGALANSMIETFGQREYYSKDNQAFLDAALGSIVGAETVRNVRVQRSNAFLKARSTWVKHNF